MAPSSPADAYRSAADLVRDGEYVDALAVIEAGLDEFEDSLVLLRRRGEILLEMRDYEAALAAYEDFVRAGPRGGNLRKARRIISDLESARTTSIVVTAEQGPVSVYLDSRARGRACVAEPSCEIGVLPGTYRVLADKEGFEPAMARASVALGQQEAVDLALTEKPSEVVVYVEPAEAEARVRVAGGDLELEALPAGARGAEAAAGDDPDADSDGADGPADAAGDDAETDDDGGTGAAPDTAAGAAGEGGAEDGAEEEADQDAGDQDAGDQDASDQDAEDTGEGLLVTEGRIAFMLPAGEHDLAISAPDFATESRQVIARRGEPAEVRVELVEFVPLALAGPGGGALDPAEVEILLGDEPAELSGEHLVAPRSGVDRQLRIRAPGYEDAAATLAADRPVGEPLSVTMAQAQPESEPVADAGGRSGLRTATAAGFAAVGATGFGMAGVFGLDASSAWSDSQAHCDDDVRCDEDGYGLVRRAQRSSSRADAALLVGGLASAAGAALYFVPEEDIGGARLYAAAGAGAAGVLSLAGATGFGLSASARWSDADENCDVRLECNEEGFADADRARRSARRANLMLAVGGTATAAALALWIYPSSADLPGLPALSADLTPDRSGASLSLSGAF